MLFEKTATLIWDILVKHAGASNYEFERQSCIYSECKHDLEKFGSSEYRFQGALGFGGKFRRTKWGNRWYVDQYPEDETPESLEIVRVTNEKLKELKERFKNEL
jgi:hypothetical protein